MNNQMSEDEIRSITAWEKANPGIMETCGKEAGWSGRQERPEAATERG